MPIAAIVIGALLILVGVAGYVHSLSTPEPSMTALIPAIFGFIIFDCGLLAKIKDGLRRHLMHVAVAVALIGFLMVAGRMGMKWGGFTMTPAFNSQFATAVLCLVFAILGVRSFMAARAARVN